MCENAKAINRDRTSQSFKSVLGARIASAFNFEIKLKNIILVTLRTFEFSHGLGPTRTFDYSAAIGPGAFARDVILRRTMSM